MYISYLGFSMPISPEFVFMTNLTKETNDQDFESEQTSGLDGSAYSLSKPVDIELRCRAIEALFVVAYSRIVFLEKEFADIS